MPSPPTVAPVSGQPVQKANPVNPDDLVTTKHSAGIVRDPVTLSNLSEVEAILRKENASSSSMSMELNAALSRQSDLKPYPSGYKVPKF